MNHTVIQVLRSILLGEGIPEDEWPDHLPIAQMAINNMTANATGSSPHYLMFGYHPVLPHEVIRPYRAEENPEDRVIRMRREFDLAQRKLLEMSEKMKKYSDQERRESPQYKVGDKVMLQTDQGKMSAKYTGPYQVIEVISPAAVKLDIGQTGAFRGCTVFHVSKLKPYKSREEVPSTQSDEREATSSTDQRSTLDGSCGTIGRLCNRNTGLVIGNCGYCKRCHIKAHKELGERYRCTKYVNHRFEERNLSYANVKTRDVLLRQIGLFSKARLRREAESKRGTVRSRAIECSQLQREFECR
jgi:hypothetical protein